MLKAILMVISFVLEGYVFFVLLDNRIEYKEWLLIISLHFIASVIFMWSSWLILPKTYQRSKLKSRIFLLLFSFFLPVFGILGVSLALLVALYLPTKQSEVTWQECEELPLPPSPGEISPNMFGEGALAEILIRNDDPERRLLAVSAIHYFPRNKAIPLLQLALKDLSDDVRLLAYSALETIEAEINVVIGLSKKQFARNETSVKASEIGQQYWELCYLGIAEGSLLNHYLREAKNYIMLSNKMAVSASNNLLLGRVLIKQHKFEEAEKYLDLAMAAGMSKSQVVPYLAECAFYARDYTRVRELVEFFPSKQGNQLSQIKELWT